MGHLYGTFNVAELPIQVTPGLTGSPDSKKTEPFQWEE